jgi:hypothetical protein
MKRGEMNLCCWVKPAVPETQFLCCAQQGRAAAPPSVRGMGAIGAPTREITMNKFAIVAITAMMALNAGAPAFAKEVCRDVRIVVIECKGSGKDKSCTPRYDTAQVCKQVPDTPAGGKAAVGGVVQGGFTSSPPSKNAISGAARMGRLN